MRCSHESCERDAVYQYAWPGRPEAGICNGHPERTAAIIAAMVPLRPAIQPVSEADTPAPRGTGRKMLEVNCDHCGTIFPAKATDRKRGWARFHSKKCKAAAQAQKRRNMQLKKHREQAGMTQAEQGEGK